MEGFLNTYAGEIAVQTLGPEGKTVLLGGQNTLPFHYFEGSPAKPKFALEVTDSEPDDWAPWLQDFYADVKSSAVDWAKKSVDVFGADMIFLNLNSMGSDLPAAEIAAGVKRVAEAISVPLIVFGLGEKEKDSTVLPVVASVCSGLKLLLGPVLKENFQEIAQAALDHGHSIIAQVPMDVNLAKDLNIKLGKFFPMDRVVIDPLTCATGYGLEYAVSTMERIRLSAIVHDDKTLQSPIIARVGREAWKTKEALQDANKGILWEAVTAFSLLLSGADIVTLRHPESLQRVKSLVN
ncbi:MAG TPA: acetyl-CoA decarbonylase/synthase complex subunit delta [Candidatus Limnocylindrales bacterium]|nr:acetyl-CoA decarbonylase/synthase complex subunit delta [Candidatus Limnocylindrales bacterium]